TVQYHDRAPVGRARSAAAGGTRGGLARGGPPAGARVQESFDTHVPLPSPSGSAHRRGERGSSGGGIRELGGPGARRGPDGTAVRAVLAVRPATGATLRDHRSGRRGAGRGGAPRARGRGGSGRRSRHAGA